jgi:HK97 family phage major capsid protein
MRITAEEVASLKMRRINAEIHSSTLLNRDRALTPGEREEIKQKQAEMLDCDVKLSAIDNATIRGLVADAGHYNGDTSEKPSVPNRRGLFQDASPEEMDQIKDLAAYLRGRNPQALANLTPGSDGGLLIPTYVQAAIERNYSQFSPVANIARLFQTDTGAPTVFPVLSDSESAVQIDPAAVTGADNSVSGDTPPTELTGPTLHAYKISSKPVFVPRETITDSDVDLVNEVFGALMARIIRYENLRYTRGNGVNQAEGFLANCSIHEQSSGTLDLDIALDLAYSVPALYRPNGSYMASDATIKYLRKLKTGIAGDKRSLWKDAFEEGNATLGTPARLHGYPIYVNNDLSDVNSDGTFGGSYSSPLVFGDFKKFVVRQAENNGPFTYLYPVPARDGRAVIVFRRSDSKLLVPEAIAKLSVGTS